MRQDSAACARFHYSYFENAYIQTGHDPSAVEFVAERLVRKLMDAC